ncbi:MAG TPA: heparinase II/III-family protein [Solirubrobacterales bacterium]
MERLLALGPPRPFLLGPEGREVTDETLQERHFEVHGRPVELRPPINWRQDPHESRSWCYQLHALTWLKPTLRMYADSGSREALAVGVETVADWVSVHLDEPAEISEFAWYDMAVSQRAPTIAYVLRASLGEDMLDREQAFALLSACNRHGDELADDSKYFADHNHGLAQDEGLYLLARQIPTLPAARAWSELATGRLRRTLKATICEKEGNHLEHSTEYQFAITRMVSRLVDTMSELPGMRELLDRLRQTTAWHVLPTGRLAQLGDTDDTPADRWAVKAASQLRGLKVLPQTGYSFVRDGGSYLAVSAGYHSSAHKHSDDTGFILAEGGQVLLGDAGRWGYYEDEPDRLYARSAFAHNVVTVDDRDFGWRESEPYGSGLLAAGEGDGWYAILVTNPLLGQQGVGHRRLLLYRPGELLVVIDDVRAEKPHDYARRFHFGPAFEARLDEQGRVVVGGENLEATLTDPADDTEVTLARGRDEPTRLGWTYPSDRKRLRVWTATLRSRAADATLVATLRLGKVEGDPAVTRAAIDAERAVVELAEGTIEVRFVPGQRQAEVHTGAPQPA